MKVLKVFEKQKKQTNKQTNKTSKTQSDDVAVSKGLLVSS